MLTGTPFVRSLSDECLQVVWRCLWPRCSWAWNDIGPHGFRTMGEWSEAVLSEMEERGLPTVQVAEAINR